jgi:diamine N-acetyltransferase
MSHDRRTTDEIQSSGREYPPYPRASAHAAVFKHDRVLLVQRANEPNRGRWALPGGVIELGETVGEAMQREVLEECGLEIVVDRVIDAVDNIIPDSQGRLRYHYVNILALAHPAAGEARPGSDALDVRWVSQGELDALDMPERGRASVRRALDLAGVAPPPAPGEPEVGPEAEVSLREVTAETVREICKLSDTLSPAHQRMVAPNAVSIAQAHFSEHAWFRAIYLDETPVGFLMLYDNPEEQVYFLWRLMIAGPYQGKGLARRALALLIDYVMTRPGATELQTSCGQGVGSPEGFYWRLGFRRTGQMVGNEVELVLTL